MTGLRKEVLEEEARAGVADTWEVSDGRSGFL